MAEVEEPFKTFKASLTNHLKGQHPTRLVCLGLGHFASCPVSRRQLALLLRLGESFGVSATVFDPAFSDLEKEFLVLQGLTVRTRNSEAKEGIPEEGAAIFFLPHCPKQLTNNLLWANWNRESLRRLFIVANSFSAIVERTPARYYTRRNYCLIR